MSDPQKTKQPRKRWIGPLAAFTIAGAVTYSQAFPSTEGFSFSRLAVAAGVGALSALLGYGVGTLIDNARR